jgi:hypothetical protein
MSDDNSQGILIGIVAAVVAGVLVAWIIQDGRFRPAPKITVANRLLLPIAVYVDNNYKGTVEANGEDSYIINGNAAKVDVEVVRDKYDNGVAFGEEMRGTVPEVEPGQVVVITNNFNNQVYYYAEITTNIPVQCAASFNVQEVSNQQGVVVVYPFAVRQGVGYFRLTPDSNIVLSCGEQSYWFGIVPNLHGRRLDTFVEPDTGRIPVMFAAQQ